MGGPKSGVHDDALWVCTNVFVSLYVSGPAQTGQRHLAVARVEVEERQLKTGPWTQVGLIA